jgi:hypothetical protein
MAFKLNLDDGIKTHCIYAAVVDGGKIYTDQTCRFTVISRRRNQKQQSHRILMIISSHGTKTDMQRTQTQTYDIGQ